MPNTTLLIKEFAEGQHDELLKDIYVDADKIIYEKTRYVEAVQKFVNLFGEAEVSIFSAPGRSEIGGNHTDHQHGEVLAASINKDCIAVVKKTEDGMVQFVSGDYDMICISVEDLEKRDSEKETTTAIVKGVLAAVKERGFQIGGFQAYITSDVLIGAGLSSSAINNLMKIYTF